MALLVRLSHPNLKYTVYDGQGIDWVDDFFERRVSRRGNPTLRVLEPTGDTKYGWELLLGNEVVSIPLSGVKAAISALVMTVDDQGRDIALYETSRPAKSVWAANAGLPTLGKR